ncbi:MAG: hypothetical protein JXA30_19135 [Deltaproteobacteria bacterium]|nr:hypothetical protein [Deltaproteobacteria bacterium]
MKQSANIITREMANHAPFTGFGTITGIVIMALMFQLKVHHDVSETLFWVFHPLHVLVSAWATAAMYRLHAEKSRIRLVVIGYLGSVGIATLSDSLIPYVGELLLDLPNKGLHFGAIEKWWLVNPLAVAGILLGRFFTTTKFPHAAHVLLSTWASLFHMTMATSARVDVITLVLVATFLFLAVWVPCCTSDIVFPLLFRDRRGEGGTT